MWPASVALPTHGCGPGTSTVIIIIIAITRLSLSWSTTSSTSSLYMLSAAAATLSWWWSPSLLLHTLSWADQINHLHRLRHHQQCWKHHHCHYHHWTSQAVITHTNHQIKWEAWMPIYIIHNEEEIPYNDRPWLPWSASITIYTLILRKIFAEIILVHFQLWCLNKEITICCLCQKKMNLYNHYSKQCHSQIALFSEIKLTQKIVTNCHV